MDVTSPNSSSVWQKYRTYQIEWDSDGYIPSVDIELWIDSEYHSDIVTDYPNSGHFSWTLTGVPTSSHSKVRVVSTIDPSADDFSSYFDIIYITHTFFQGYISSAWNTQARVHSCSNTSWSESSINWNNKPNYSAQILATPTTGYDSHGNEFHQYNLGPDLIRDWYDGTGDGCIVIDTPPTNHAHTRYYSSEADDHINEPRPELIVWFDIDESSHAVTITPSEDSWVDSANPSQVQGNSQYLRAYFLDGRICMMFIKWEDIDDMIP